MHIIADLRRQLADEKEQHAFDMEVLRQVQAERERLETENARLREIVASGKCCVCPACGGSGEVQTGVVGTAGSLTSGWKKCDVCNGRRVVLQPGEAAEKASQP